MRMCYVGVVSLGIIFLAMGCASNFCIGINSKIAVPDGVKLIQNLKEGDEVLSWSFSHNKVTTSKIKKIISGKTNKYKLINNHLSITKDHIIYDFSEEKWIKVSELDSNSQIGILKNSKIELHSYHYSEINEKIKTFDIQLEGQNNNYFANSILVHNKTPAIREYKDKSCTIIHNNEMCESKVGLIKTCPTGFSEGFCDRKKFEFLCMYDDANNNIRSFIFYNPTVFEKSEIDLTKYCKN